MDEFKNMEDQTIGWDDEIENDGEAKIIPEGDYVFTVVNFERGRYPGSAKLPACNKAVLTLKVSTPDGEFTVRTDLLLCRQLEWRLSAFFRAIGRKQSGERIQMDWNSVPGSKGRAHFNTRSYTAASGETMKVNNVARFLDWEEKYFPAARVSMSELTEDGQLPF